MGKSREIFKYITISILLIDFGTEYIYLTSILFLISIYTDLLKNFNQILLAALAVISYYYFGLEKTEIGNYFLLFIFLISLIISKNSNKISLDSRFVQAILFLNIIIIILYPYATQSLNYETLANEIDIPKGLQYLLINTIGSFVIILISLNKRDKKLHILTLIFLLLSSKTTSLIVFILGFIINNLKLKKSSLIYLSSIVFLFTILIYNINITDYIQNRLDVLIRLDIDSEELIRFPLALVSIQTFFENPLFGIGFYKENVEFATDFLITSVGHHSHLFDGLARFGIIWFIVIFLDVNRFAGFNILLVLIWFVLNNVIGLEWLILSLINLNNEKKSSPSPRYQCRGY